MVQTDHQGKHLIKKINFESLNESHGAKEEFSWLYDLISVTAKDGGKKIYDAINTRNTVISKNCIKKKTYRKLGNGGSHDA